MKKVFTIILLIFLGAFVFFILNPIYLYINDTDIVISGVIQQASSPSCDLNLSPRTKAWRNTCNHPEVFYENHGGVWFTQKWNVTDLFVLKIVHFSNADSHFLEVVSGKSESDDL